MFLPPIHSADPAGVDIEGLGHCLVHLMDWKFVGDEPVQRIGGLECVQETQAARVAIGGWLVIPQRRIWLAGRRLCGRLRDRSRKCEPGDGFKDSHLSSLVVEWRGGGVCPR